MKIVKIKKTLKMKKFIFQKISNRSQLIHQEAI